MKVTRELIDNGKKIIHIKYTKKEIEAREDEFDAKFIKEMEERRKQMEAEREAVEADK